MPGSTGRSREGAAICGTPFSTPHLARNVRRLLVFLCLAGAIGLAACYRRVSVRPVTSAVVPPNYFGLMAAGRAAERGRDYRAAINWYTTAASAVGTVSPDLRRDAKVAVHNRIGACYRAMHQVELARAEFKAAEALGDRRFAPNALRSLERDGPAPSKGDPL